MHLPPLFSIVVTAYWTVLVVELLGDKAIYTITSLTSCYSPARVYVGIVVAFMVKMLIAVVFAQFLLAVPADVGYGVSAIILLGTGLALWMKPPRSRLLLQRSGFNLRSNAFVIAFAAIFFSEWADVGQLSAAALSAQYGMPLAVWLGGTAALMTKGILALTLGMQLRRMMPDRALKLIAAGSCCVLGMLAIRKLLGG